MLTLYAGFWKENDIKNYDNKADNKMIRVIQNNEETKQTKKQTNERYMNKI